MPHGFEGGELKLDGSEGRKIGLASKLACQVLKLGTYRLRIVSFAASALICMATTPVAWAIGTIAGTIIPSVATVSYSLDGVAQPDVNVEVTVKVDEVIQPALTWQDAAPVAVNSPDTNIALTFLLTNAGNGQESFSLSRVNGLVPLPPGNYVPLNGAAGSIFLENGLLAGFQATGPNADTLYVAGTNDPSLPPDSGQKVYVISDTPLVVLGSYGEVSLEASSLTAGVAGAAVGTGFSGLGQGGNFAVVGLGNGRSADMGRYISGGLGLTLAKNVTSVVDPSGSASKMPGAVMTYQLVANLTGSGIANNLTIADPLPAEVAYVPASVTVDGVAKSDAVDVDNAEFNSATQTVSVSLGNVAAPATIVVTFRATIK